MPVGARPYPNQIVGVGRRVGWGIESEALDLYFRAVKDVVECSSSMNVT